MWAKLIPRIDLRLKIKFLVSGSVCDRWSQTVFIFCCKLSVFSFVSILIEAFKAGKFQTCVLRLIWWNLFLSIPGPIENNDIACVGAGSGPSAAINLSSTSSSLNTQVKLNVFYLQPYTRHGVTWVRCRYVEGAPLPLQVTFHGCEFLIARLVATKRRAAWHFGVTQIDRQIILLPVWCRRVARLGLPECRKWSASTGHIIIPMMLCQTASLHISGVSCFSKSLKRAMNAASVGETSFLPCFSRHELPRFFLDAEEMHVW